MSSYGLTEEQRRGIIEEDRIIPLLTSSMKSKWGREVNISKSKDVDNWRSKIDYHIQIGEKEFTADYKSGDSFTLYGHRGDNLLNQSQADWIIKGERDKFVFIKVERLKEVVKKFPPRVFRSKTNNSQYFWLGQYLARLSSHFGDKELFSAPKIS